MVEAQPAVIGGVPFNKDGVIPLGPSTGAALRRLANHASLFLKSGEPIPNSPFIDALADRLTGDDRQDCIIFLQGRRGSGKSYSAMYLAKRISEAISRRKGGTWRDYFSLKNCITLQDSQGVLAVMNETEKNQVLIVDDASLAVSNRGWNSQENKNVNALLSICRTNRWCLIFTSPIKAHVDLQVRQMTDITITVYKSFHAGGFNILKIHRNEAGLSGKEYSRRLSFGKNKVDFWVCFRPDIELTREYDAVRDSSARIINQRIVATGSFKAGKEKDTRSVIEKNTDRILDEKGEAIRSFLKNNPDISINKLAAEFQLSHGVARRVVSALK